nr:hypothetical protein [Tanacetum cinerariifolium]
MSEMITCSPQSSWYPDIKTCNSSVPCYLLSLQMQTSGTLMLIRSTMQLLHELHHLRIKLVSERRRVVPTPQSLLLQLLLQAQDCPPLLKANSQLQPLKLRVYLFSQSGSGADEGSGTIPGVFDVPTDESEEEISWNSTDEEGDDNDDEGDDSKEGNDDDDDAQDDDDQEDERNDEDDQEEGSDDEQAFDEEEFIHLSLSTHDEEETRNEETFDPIPKTPENTYDEGNDFAYLMREDFVYQVEHKDTKKSNEMYYLGSYRDDHMFTTIKLVSRHQNMQQFGAMLPIELTNADIMNSDAYKEYYAVATGATPPKNKASIRKTKSSSDTTVTPPPTAAFFQPDIPGIVAVSFVIALYYTFLY